MKTLLPAISRIIVTFLMLICFKMEVTAQNVSEIITDYGGFHKSSNTAINSIKPDSSHDLLAFTFNGTRYSTGVNDARLIEKGEGNFMAQVFKALPVSGITNAANANTKIGLGQMYDKVDNGPSNPRPSNNMAYYLTDGVNGLNLGTGVANLPAGELKFDISNIKSSTIGDGIPDIIITQIADPSAGVDKYRFVDADNVIIGSEVSINFSSMQSVGNWTADFYQALPEPMILSAGFTKTDRPIRVWAADFSAFGITVSNFTNIKNFKIRLNGNSDIAFIAYNTSSYLVLPIQFSSFKAKQVEKNVLLDWQLSETTGMDYMEVQRSTDANNFKTIATMEGYASATSSNYKYVDVSLAAGIYYYRIKIVSKDNSAIYSEIKTASFENETSNSFAVYPNPARAVVTVAYNAAGKNDVIEILSLTGQLVKTVKPGAQSQSSVIDLSGLQNNTYLVSLKTNGRKLPAVKLIKQ